MTTGRPGMRLVNGGTPEDAVVRRRRFEQAHPEAVILPPARGRLQASLDAVLAEQDERAGIAHAS